MARARENERASERASERERIREKERERERERREDERGGERRVAAAATSDRAAAAAGHRRAACGAGSACRDVSWHEMTWRGPARPTATHSLPLTSPPHVTTSTSAIGDDDGGGGGGGGARSHARVGAGPTRRSIDRSVGRSVGQSGAGRRRRAWACGAERTHFSGRSLRVVSMGPHGLRSM